MARGSTRLGQQQVALTYVRGLLGGGGCEEKLPLVAESLLHQVCLEREDKSE